MENDQTQPIQPTTSPFPPVQQKPSQLPIILLSLLSLIFLSGMIYFYFQVQSLKKQLADRPSPTLVSSAPSTPSTTTAPTTNSQAFQITELGLTFQLPDKLTKLGSWEGTTILGDTGSNICFHLLPNASLLVHSVRAGGVGICSGKYLIINSVSSDFTAGRGGSFNDISGYRVKNGEYFLGLRNFEGELPLSTNSPKEITTISGLKYLLINGEDVDNPSQILPARYIGALINTGNQKYPGIAVSMQLSDQLTATDFSQILDTFKFEK